MKNKLYWIVCLIEGILLLVVSVAIPVYKTMNSNIIGGADLATFSLHFQKTAWLAFAGIVFSIISAVVLKIRK